MTISQRSKELAEEAARHVPDDIHVPTLALMIEQRGTTDIIEAIAMAVAVPRTVPTAMARR